MRPLHVLLLFLVAVIVGRLALEPSGVGLVILLIMLPALTIAVVAMLGWRAGALFLVFVIPVAAAVRFLLVAVPQAWLVVVLAPVLAAVGAMAVSVARTMWRERGAPGAAARDPKREEEEE